MTIDEFRSLALSFPEAVEGSHMGHPDFRVGGKIFATIAPYGVRGMARLKPDQQVHLALAEPGVFEPASGAWGTGGATMIDLTPADEGSVRLAPNAAWRNTAPKKTLRAARSIRLTRKSSKSRKSLRSRQPGFPQS